MVDSRPRHDARRCCSPTPARNVVAGIRGEPAALEPDLFDGCEVVVSPRSSTSASRRRRSRPVPRRRSGARTAGCTALVPEPGRAGHQGPAWPACSASTPSPGAGSSRPTSAAGSAPRSAPTPSTRWSPWLAQHARPPGPLDRDAVGEHGRHGPRPRPRARPSRSAARRDGNVAGLPAGGPAGLRRLPEDRRDAAVPDPADGAGRLRHCPGSSRSATRRGHQHHADRRLPRRRPARGDGRDRAGHGPVRRRDRHGPGRGAPQEPASPPFTEPHDDARRRDLRQRRLRRPRSTRCSTAADYAELRAEQAAPARERRRRASSASACRSTSRSPAACRRRHAPRTRTVEVHADGTATVLTGTSPHGQGHDTAWAMLASEQTRHPDRQDHRAVRGDTDLVPEGGGTVGSRSLQQGGAAVQQAAHRAGRRWPSSAPPSCSRRAAADLVLDTSRGAFHVAGAPDVRASPLAAAAPSNERLLIAHGVHRAGRRRSRSAPTSPSSRSTPRPARRRCRASSPCDDAGTDPQPAARRGPAPRRHRPGRRPGAARGGASTTTTATRSRRTSPTTRSSRRPSCRASSSSTMETPTSYNPLGAKGIGEAGTIGSTPAVQNAVVDAVAHLGVRHIDMPTASDAGVAGDPGRRKLERSSHDAASSSPSTARRARTTSSRGCCSSTTCARCCGLRATNVGCDTTSCGACTVLLDGESVKSCTVLAVQADGQEVSDRSKGWPTRRQAAPGAGGVPRRARAAVRLLHAGHGDGRRRAAGENPHPTEEEVRDGPRGQPLPLHRLSQHRPRGAARPDTPSQNQGVSA